MKIRSEQILVNFSTIWSKSNDYLQKSDYYGLLEIGEKYLRFLFLLSKLEQRTILFSFSSRNWGNGIQISLPPLEIGELVFKFLFFFSIGLLCLSSTTGTGSTQQSCVAFIIEISQMGKRALSHYHSHNYHTVTLSHCHGILSKLQGNSHNECSSCNNDHQKVKLIHVPSRMSCLFLLSHVSSITHIYL